MRRLCATGLMLAIGCQPISAAGPLERSVSREASRLAREAAGDPDRSAWKAVRLLDPGTSIVITTADALITGTFESIDGAALAVTRNDALERISLDDVLMVEKRLRRGSSMAAALGAVVGVWLGGSLAFGVAEHTRCYNSCGGVEAAMLATVIGVPIGAGYGAWRGTSHMVEEVVYRRPPPRP